ncbi:hypothetical protein H4217_000643 [Coemansia sp. RSA 1939]|nr:hypothetical protein H4217_000643 [Coemansia sp. RSA 1939]KAJ2671796.1 hypothetical protein GGH99_006149 [Coemansia sp. RSA 1285]
MDGDLDFENMPLVTLLNDLLSEYEASVRTLLRQLDTVGSSSSGTSTSNNSRNTGNAAATTTTARVDTAKRLASLDRNLQRLYGEISHHQTRQQEIRRTQVLSIESGKAKLHFINNMLDAKQQLEETVADVGRKIESAQRAQKARPPVAEIIEYARKLGMFTSAPPNFDPNNIRSGALPPEPPHPLLLVMRAGTLNRYRTKKVAVDSADNDDEVDDDMFASHMDDDQFDDIDADDLLLSLDLNPDLS